MPLSARQFSAADVPNLKLKRAGKIVISNDDQSIRARHVAGSIETTLVELKSLRLRVTAPMSVRSGGGDPMRGVPAQLAPIFAEAAGRYSIDPALLVAVARQESRFRPQAVSPVGARGVMQLMPATAQWLGVTNSFDARENILGGAKYLRMLLDTFGGDIALSLAAYNAGPGAVKKHRGIPPYRETVGYVAAIRRDYEGR